MPNFLENIFNQLRTARSRVVLQEVHAKEFVSVTGGQFLEQVGRVRAYLRQRGVQPGDRCALLGANSIKLAVVDIALMAEGAIVVPLYSRQAAAELAGMMKDCAARFLFCSDTALGDGVAQAWPEVPPRVLFDEAIGQIPPGQGIDSGPNSRKGEDLLTIIYTSGTSGEPKGVCLNTTNVDHMISCTTARLDELMEGATKPDRVFHYLPFNFAGSWILLLSCLSRDSTLTLSTDMNKLADEIQHSSPHYFMNVPTLLERVRRGVEDAISKRDSAIQAIYRNARAAWERKTDGQGKTKGLDSFWLFLGRNLIFRKIRARFGSNLRALICGSAPLSPETQQFFHMVSIPVLQVYGLTETTAICTMDDPRTTPEPGRVGKCIPGIEMNTGENDEILVRGPNVFPGYWNRPDETARVLKDGWFHTGDQGEVNSLGNWRISGRIKNLIVLNSGHNIAPEPIEEKLAQQLPGARQIVVVGNGHGYLTVLLTGALDPQSVQEALDRVNSDLPHYRQLRNFTILPEALTTESGLLTAMGKVKRDAIHARFYDEIERMYSKQASAAGGKSR